MDSLLKKAKIVCLAVVSVVMLGCGIKTYVLLGHIDGLITKEQPRLEAVLDNSNATLTSLHQAIGSVNTTVLEAKSAVSDARSLIVKQGGYQDAQNKRILDVIDQSETALINFQVAVDDIDQNQGKLTTAAVDEINRLSPLIESATLTVTEAGKTIADPNLKKTLENLAGTMANVESGTLHLDHTLGLVDKKVDDAMKPKKPIVKIFDGFYRSLVVASELKGLLP